MYSSSGKTNGPPQSTTSFFSTGLLDSYQESTPYHHVEKVEITPKTIEKLIDEIKKISYNLKYNELILYNAKEPNIYLICKIFEEIQSINKITITNPGENVINAILERDGEEHQEYLYNKKHFENTDPSEEQTSKDLYDYSVETPTTCSETMKEGPKPLNSLTESIFNRLNERPLDEKELLTSLDASINLQRSVHLKKSVEHIKNEMATCNIQKSNQTLTVARFKACIEEIIKENILEPVDELKNKLRKLINNTPDTSTKNFFQIIGYGLLSKTLSDCKIYTEMFNYIQECSRIISQESREEFISYVSYMLFSYIFDIDKSVSDNKNQLQSAHIKKAVQEIKKLEKINIFLAKEILIKLSIMIGEEKKSEEKENAIFNVLFLKLIQKYNIKTHLNQFIAALATDTIDQQMLEKLDHTVLQINKFNNYDIEATLQKLDRFFASCLNLKPTSDMHIQNVNNLKSTVYNKFSNQLAIKDIHVALKIAKLQYDINFSGKLAFEEISETLLNEKRFAEFLQCLEYIYSNCTNKFTSKIIEKYIVNKMIPSEYKQQIAKISEELALNNILEEYKLKYLKKPFDHIGFSKNILDDYEKILNEQVIISIIEEISTSKTTNKGSNAKIEFAPLYLDLTRIAIKAKNWEHADNFANASRRLSEDTRWDPSMELAMELANTYINAKEENAVHYLEKAIEITKSLEKIIPEKALQLKMKIKFVVVENKNIKES